MNASASTILIVDDNPIGREVLGDVLESDVYKLYYASDGPEALSLAADIDPDVILLDVMMPDMDGYEVCRRLRANSKLCEVPVLMVSALDDRLSRLKGIEVGADDFVSKPIDRMELLARVRTIVRLNRYRKLQEQQRLRKRVEEEREELRIQLYRAKHTESLGQLAAGLAHDYNNLLTVIMGNAELAMKETTSDHLRLASLHEIRTAAQHAASLTRKLLAYSQKQIVAPQIINLNSTLESIEPILHQTLGDQIEICWFLGHDLGSIEIDPAQFKQMLVNLCQNARDAMEGQGRVTIETRYANIEDSYTRKFPDSSPGRYFILIMTDTGCGMSPEILERIFEPYFTTQKMDNTKGRGLGLAAVHGIVRQNDGFIEVFSEPKCGTTLKIFLPIHAVDPPKIVPETLAPDLEDRRATVLVVEDNLGILDLITHILRLQPYTILPSSNSADALILAEKHPRPIDLLITDIMLPDMDGLALADLLTVRQPNLKCLFISGYSADVISKNGKLDDGVHFMAKPFTAQELTEKTKQVLAAPGVVPE